MKCFAWKVCVCTISWTKCHLVWHFAVYFKDIHTFYVWPNCPESFWGRCHCKNKYRGDLPWWELKAELEQDSLRQLIDSFTFGLSKKINQTNTHQLSFLVKMLKSAFIACVCEFKSLIWFSLFVIFISVEEVESVFSSAVKSI